MVAKTRADIQTEITSLLADNITGDISPADVRTVHETSKDSNLNLLDTSGTQTIAGTVNHTGALLVSSEPVEPLKKVRVNSSADLPSPTTIGGVSTIRLADKHYIINQSLSLTEPFALPGAGLRTTLEFVNRARITNTSTNAIFRDPGAEGELEIFGLAELAATGGNDVWDITAGAGGFSIQSQAGLRVTQCEAIGTIDCGGVGGVGFFFGSFQNFNQGLVVTHSFFTELNTLFMQGNNQTGCVYVTVDGASTVGSVNMLTLTVLSGSNETAFDFDPAIQAGVDSINIRGCQQEGGLNGAVYAAGSLTGKSNKVLAFGNPLTGDTKPGGMLSMTGNTTDTDIEAVNTPVLAAGTWAVVDESQFTGTTSGRLTYNDTRDITIEIDAAISLEPATGNGKVMAAYIAKNGAVITASRKEVTVDNADPQNIALLWRDDAVTNDYYEIWVENRTDAIDVTVTDAVLRMP
jgi:hypothetical protein